MTPEEESDYIEGEAKLVLVSNGPDGLPHPMPMFFTRTPSGSILISTYATSQKTRNIERDPRVALLFESGTDYDELKGIVLYGRAKIVRDPDRVFEFMTRSEESLDDAGTEHYRQAATKRVLLEIEVDRSISWDHGKL
jgi:PPOX class probable F420-dependent enzyme